MVDSVEREVKLRPPPGFDLSELEVAGTTRHPLPRLELKATYYDTADLTLARSGITVRYRTGEPPDRWTVKLPTGSTGHTLVRREVDLEDPDPREIDALLAAHLRGRPLEPVADITTTRVRSALHDEAGEPLVEIAHDLVVSDPVQGEASCWEEAEVEAVDAERGAGAVRRATAALRDLGCRRAPATPKLVRALGERAAAPPDVVVPALRREPRAVDALEHALARSVRQILDHDPRVRLGGDPEDLHHLRVAGRRMRSDLRLLRGSVEDGEVDQLDADLCWVAGATNRCRDLDVLLWWLQLRGASLPAESEPGLRSLVARCEREQAEARDAVLEVLGSDRYQAMISELVAVVTTRLPAAGVDDDELRRRLRRQLRRRWRKLEQRMGRFEEDPESDLALHRARIAAKRCRAVAEAYAPVGGKRAVRFARSLPKLQDALGAEHDADVIRTWLRTAADVDAAFVAGELAATARADAARQQERWPKIWDRVQRRSRHL